MAGLKESPTNGTSSTIIERMISKLPRKHRLGISSIPRPQSIAVAASSRSRADD
jgi:hypothetical protein